MSEFNPLYEVQQLINSGCGEEAMEILAPLLDYQGAKREMVNVFYADTLRVLKRYDEAADEYIKAARKGGGYASVLWRRAGEARLEEKKLDEALVLLRHAISIDPMDTTAHHLCGMILFSSTLNTQGVCHASHLLKYADNDNMLSTAENLFRFALLPMEAYLAVKRRAEIHGSEDSFLGLLTCAAQGICDWDNAIRYADMLEEKYYNKGDFFTVREIPLYNIARTANEYINLEVAKSGVYEFIDRKPAYDHSQRQWGDKIRIGLLSADFASHPVIQLIIGLCENLDKNRFELYAYDDGKNPSMGESRLSFCLSKHIDMREQPDEYVAKCVYEDKIDILIDLMGQTTKNRLGVLALRPSAVTASFLGFPGSTGLHSVDYMITDATITPDSSKPFYAEKLCRLPEVFMPCDNKRVLASNEVSRAELGLPEKGVVFCSFNRSFKLDKESVHLWMRILSRVPNSVLWQKADEIHMKQVFQDTARLYNVDPDRIIFAGSTSSVPLHLTRTGVADIGLDTLIYNGHTITTDQLWAGVPVITRTGTHFASRVSSSLLKAVGLPELITSSVQEMEDVAVNLALNPAKLREIKARLQENIKIMPLFDTQRYTRHFEQAMELMLNRAKEGLPAEHIDVPALPPRTTAFLEDGPPKVHEAMAGIPKKGDYADMSESLQTQKSPYAIHYGCCPICSTPPPSIGLPVSVKQHELWASPMPDTTFWVECQKCGHLSANSFWSGEGGAALKSRQTGKNPELDSFVENRERYVPLLEKVHSLNLNPKSVPAPIWLEVDCLDMNLSMLAGEYGYNINILSQDGNFVNKINSELFISAWQADFISANFTGEPSVMLMNYCLNKIAYPTLALDRCYNMLKTGGLLVASFVDKNALAWRLYGMNEHNICLQNPSWIHAFARDEMERLFKDSGFVNAGYVVDSKVAGGVYLIGRKV